MGPRLIPWYFCQLVIKYADEKEYPPKTTRYCATRSPKLFLEGAPFLRYTLITKLAGVGKLLRLRGARNHFPEGSIFFLSKFS